MTTTIGLGVTLTNTATLSVGVILAGGRVSNTATGTIVSVAGDAIYGQAGVTSNVINAGVISNPAYGTKIDLRGGGSVTNQSGGTIAGSSGIYGGAYNASGAVLTVVNAGTITGADLYGILLYDGGSVTNLSGASVSGVELAVYSGPGGTMTLVNDGRIASQKWFAVLANGGGSVTNQTGGTISGSYGVGGSGRAMNVVNAGAILASGMRSQGIKLFTGGSVTNQSGGTIAGAGGIYAGHLQGTGAAATVVNAGGITATSGYGILLFDGGSITNLSGASISGQATAVYSGAGGALTVTNDGLIAEHLQYGFGVYAQAGGSVTNLADGTISGYYGIGASGGAMTVVNAGSIIASSHHAGAAVHLTTGFTNLLAFEPGAVFVGSVSGGNTAGAAHVSTLELASGTSTGMLTGLGTQFVEFARVIVDAAAQWTLGTTDTVGSGVTLTNAGTLTGGVTLAPGGALSNASTGMIAVTSGSAVHALTGGVAAVVNAGSIGGGSGTGVLLSAGGNLINRGGASISGSYGISAASGALTVVNAGIIAGTNDAVKFAAGQANRLTIDPGAIFTGTVDGGNTIGASAASTLDLASGASAGTLSGIGTQFVDFARITVDTGASWTLAGSNSLAAGTSLSNAGTLTDTGTLTNAGILSGSLLLAAGGVLSNAATGTVAVSGGAAINGLTGGMAAIVNAGTITNASTSAGQGIDLTAGGGVTNLSSGSISGYSGIKGGTFGALSVVNAGTIAGTAYAVKFAAGYAGRLTIDPGAVFTGQVDGGNTLGAAVASTLELASAALTGTLAGIGSQFTDFARIAVETGAQWMLAGTNTIAAGETLSNAGTLTDTGALTNAGLITGGIRLAPGVTFSNTSTGTLSASSGAAVSGLSGGATTVVNAGSITGTGGAISFASGYANRLVIDPGAVFSSTVDGGNTIGATAISTLEMASGTGTLSGIGTQFVNFVQTTIDVGAAWSLTGTNTLAAGTTITNSGMLTLLSATLSDAGTAIDNGTISVDASTLMLTGLTGIGNVKIGSSGTLDIAGSVGVGITIEFDSNDGVLTFDPTQFAGQIAGFGAGDVMHLTGVNDATSANVVNGNTLEIQRTDHAAIDLRLAAVCDPGSNAFSVMSAPAILTDNPACFLSETLIRTDRGDVPVELLLAGDRVVTLSGAERPIRWIGHRSLDLTRHPAPHRVQPIRIRAHAFADGQPNRDLFLSPEHAVLRDGVLVPIRLLVNGASIQRDSGHRSITYYHVELETHDILLAENLAAESYLETGNRGVFENAPDPLQLHPDLTNDQARREAMSCVPFLDDPARLEPIWRALAVRAEQLGPALPPATGVTDDPALCLIVDGSRVASISSTNGNHIFVVPAGAIDVRLRSRGAVPSDATPWVSDDRRLGVLLAGLTVRSGAEVVSVPLDHPGFGAGWWQPEWHGPTTLRRWTDGDAVVPIAAPATGRWVLEVYVAATMPYPVALATPEPLSMLRSA